MSSLRSIVQESQHLTSQSPPIIVSTKNQTMAIGVGGKFVLLMVFFSFQLCAALIFPSLPHNLLSRPVQNPEAYMSTVDMIEHRGYRAEVHEVTTIDQYILSIHRILPPKTRPQTDNTKKAVYLQHGMVSNDHIWIMNPTDRALAYILVDMGYDVFMGNSRGTEYSRKHATLDPKDSDYWQFGWDEMGGIDVPTIMQYILSLTNQKSLVYICHSLGCALLFIAMNEHPELNDSVDVMFALGPTSSVAHLKGATRFAADLAPVRHSLLLSARKQKRAFLANTGSLSQRIQRAFCDSTLLGSILCRNYIFSIFGTNSNNFNMSNIAVINGHYPSGGSIKTIVHFFQNYYSGEEFHRFDYGPRENIKKYGQPTPPTYDLSLVKAPVYLYFGDNDPLAPPEDVKWLASHLGNVKDCIRVDDPNWTHGDFLWSDRAAELVHSSIIQRLPPPNIS